jgi:hypothetical protein
LHHFPFWIFDFGFWIEDGRWMVNAQLLSDGPIQNPKSKIQNAWAGVAQLVERQPSKLNVASSSLVSRSIVFLQIGPK